MDSNTYSTSGSAGLAELAADLDALAAQDPERLPNGVRAQRVLELQRLRDRLEGHWLAELAAVDARGAAGADQGVPAPSTASWLRNRLHMSAATAHSAVRTARALFRGPLTQTAQALTAGELSPAHARVLAAGTHICPPTPRSRPNRCCWRRLGGSTHPDSARSSATCGWSPTPTASTTGTSGAISSVACGCRPPWTIWSRWTACWTPRPARPSWPP
jgi:hypothetical protein